MTKNSGDLPTPPLPKWMLDPKDVQYKEAEPVNAETIRGRLQLMSSQALDVLEFHMRNLGDAKNSEAACYDILDRAGYGKPKAGEPVSQSPAGGESVPSVEDMVRDLQE